MLYTRIRHAPDDDEHAPQDYRYVHSVREGERQRQAEAQRQRQSAVVRHRALPADSPARADEYGTRARQPYILRQEAAQQGFASAAQPRPASALVRRVADDSPVAYPGESGFRTARPDEPAASAPPAVPTRPAALAQSAASVPPAAEPPRFVLPQEDEGGPSYRRYRRQSAALREDATAGQPAAMAGQPAAIAGQPAATADGQAPAASAHSAAPTAPTRASLAQDPFSQPETVPVYQDGEGRAFAAPASPEVPEWYRVAQQNAPLDSRRAAAPRVQRAAAAEPDEGDEAVYPDAVYDGLSDRERAEALRQNQSSEGKPFFVRGREASAAPQGAGYTPRQPKAWGEPAAAVPPRAAAPTAYERMHAARGERPRMASPEPTDAERTQSILPEPTVREPYGERRPASGYDPYADARAQQPAWDGAGYRPAQPETRPPRRNPYADEAYADEPYQRRAPRAAREDVPDAEDKPAKPGVPWLGLAAGLMCLVAIGLFLLGLSFERQAKAIEDERAEAALALENKYRVTLVEDGATAETSRFDTYRALIEREAEANNLHPAFVSAIIYNESTFRPEVESSVGARGLMQMMEETASWVASKTGFTTGYSFDLMYDPATNVKFACWYLRYLSDQFNADPVLVAAAFHAGQGTVNNWLADSSVSPDGKSIDLSRMQDGPTKRYATRVLAAYAAYKRLFYETVQ